MTNCIADQVTCTKPPTAQFHARNIQHFLNVTLDTFVALHSI